ncbi:MAG: undecaprenyl/decaprenyl-phosphate alpha-N-acetylglucosaminyl 1-phosphate transferase [Patescibacteria group bacterium]|nr:undecaprenyl/decaprenyl-phosphate alpha-N-acetylglucosaminyl 1-phosphate transferase [Patescibacteria group bacterium]
MIFLLYFLLSLILALLLVPLIKTLAIKTKVLDLPKSQRKIHKQPVPLLGGVAVFLALALALLAYLFFGRPDFNVVPVKFFLAIIGGGLTLTLGGMLDDKFDLPPKILWLFPAIASLIVVWSGIGVGIKFISNPFGAPINIGYHLGIGNWGLEISAVIMWLWMMGMIFTTKLLDGLDGLCGGVGLIGALTMFALSLTAKVNQPITATIAIIFAGALAGFLVYNFNPAVIFLGESGSTLIGFVLGVLAIILGAKIATALLIMGIPILDVAWAIIRRVVYRRSPFEGDRSHLHYRLLDIGLSQKQAVLVLWLISASFGFTAVFLQSMGKLIALVILFCLMIALAISVVIIYKRQHPHIPDLFDYEKHPNVYRGD